MGLWNVPAGLRQVPTILLHIMHFVLNMIVNPSLFEKRHHNPMNLPRSVRWAQFNQLNIYVVLGVNSSDIVVILEKSVVLHLGAERGLLIA